jgi:hypothetical protein
MHRLEPTSRPPALPDWLVWRRVVGAVVAPLALLAAPAGCETPTSATALNPEGPAMIRQVMVQEAYLNPNGQRVWRGGSRSGRTLTRRRGTSSTWRRRWRTTCRRSGWCWTSCWWGTSWRRSRAGARVDEDAYTEVPVGATPDDIAKCAVALDILPETCVGDLAVCVGANPAMPVGVLDEDEDGTSDDTRFIRGAVRLVCAGIDVPLNIDQTYWQPSGTQLPPAQGRAGRAGPGGGAAAGAWAADGRRVHGRVQRSGGGQDRQRRVRAGGRRHRERVRAGRHVKGVVRDRAAGGDGRVPARRGGERIAAGAGADVFAVLGVVPGADRRADAGHGDDRACDPVHGGAERGTRGRTGCCGSTAGTTRGPPTR